MFLELKYCIPLLLTIIFLIAIVVFLLRKYFKEMKKSEKRYSTLVEGASDGVVVVREGSIRYANPAFLKMIGEDNVVEKDIFSLFAKEDKESLYDYYKKRRESKNISPFYEGKIINKDGRSVDVEISIGIVEHRSFSEELIIVRDITKKKKVEEIFDYQEEKFRALSENTPDIIARFDRECRYIYVNSAAEKEHGIPQREFFWKTEKDLGFSEERIEANSQAINSVFKTGRPTSFYSEVGGKHYYTILIPETTKQGSVRSVLSISRDITELREIDKAKSDFIAITSHQLKSPLSIIRWSAISLLEDDVFQGEHRESLENIYEATKKLVKLSDTFVNATTLDLGMFIFNPKETDFVEIIKSVVKEYREIAQKRGVEIEEKYSSMPSMLIDPYTIKIISRGIISNAVDYTQEKGKVSVSVLKEGEEIIFRVSDDGCGIEKKDQKKVFEKFYRTEESKKMKSYGTGLNMYIIKSILDKKDGKIYIESPNSEFGKGTCVTVTIPQG